MTLAFATLLHGEDYVAGALTLGRTLLQFGTRAKLAILLNKLTLSETLVSLVEEVYNDVIDISDTQVQAPVETVASKLGRLELAITFSKILLWSLTQYDQIVFLDSDTLPLRPLDELFAAYSDISTLEIVAAPDIGWPDLFNLGVFVIRPLKAAFDEILKFSEGAEPLFDGADQGLLNEFFTLQDNGYSWRRLPFVYNVTPSPHYQYVPALDRFRSEIRLVHFIGANKPWHASYEGHDEFRELWWKKFNEFYENQKSRIHLLLRPHGEAHQLSFKRLVNAWDTEEAFPLIGDLNIAERAPKKVFPWEEHERVEPTRVFQPVSYAKETGGGTERRVSLEGDREARVHLAGSGRSLRRASNQFKDEVDFNPDKALEEVLKMPLRFLQSKRKELK